MPILGKRKYRRNAYDNTMHQGGSGSISKVSFTKGLNPTNNDQHHQSMSGQGDSEPKYDDENGDSDAKRRLVDNENGLMPPPTPTQFTCRVCQEEFSQLRSLVKHMALSHFNHIWNAENTTNPSSENGGSEYPTENENPYAVPQAGPYNCHLCYEYQTESREEFIVHLAWRHEVLKAMVGEYADYKNSNEYDVPANTTAEDGEPEIDGQEYPDFDIDDEMEENDDLGDVDEAEGEDEFEEEGFPSGEPDDVTVDEMDGLNVGEIDVPSDVEGESDDEVQIQ